MELEILGLLFCVGLMAGTLDAIAGGGGLLSVPALISAGLPPAQVLATNKAQSVCGTVSAAHYFWKQGLIDRQFVLPSAIGALIGGATGSVLILSLNAEMLSRLIPFLLIAFAIYFAFSPKISDQDHPPRMTANTFAMSFAVIIGTYDGFFGPGTGSFFTLACVSIMGFSLLKATAHAKVFNVCSNSGALLMFMANGQVVWQVAGFMVAGQLIGAQIGARLANFHGKRLIKPVLVTITLVMSAKLLAQHWL